jgi:peptidoglycan/LPS O-acetylase OafA/YrhL
MNKFFFSYSLPDVPLAYMSVATVTMVLMILASAFTYRYIELPFIKLGHRLPKSLDKLTKEQVSPTPADGQFTDGGAALNPSASPLLDPVQTPSVRSAS